METSLQPFLCTTWTRSGANASKPWAIPWALVTQDGWIEDPNALLYSPACERNQQPILDVLHQWLPARASVLEIGSGSGQHAIGFTRLLAGLQWQPSDRGEFLQDLNERIELEGCAGLAPGARVAKPLELDVDRADHWPRHQFDAVFSANCCHIMAETSVPNLIAGAASRLGPGGLLLLYGPFQDGGVHTAASNAAFDAHLRSLDPLMGVRDAQEIRSWAQDQDLQLRADQPMPAQNRILIFQRV
jgi:SAM-dependent methyltransferase